jgi:hypothetical protein
MGKMRQEEATLSPRQRRAIVALLESPSVLSAAERAGVNRNTLNRWLALPAFRSALDRAKEETFNAAMARIASASGEATNTLLKLLTAESEAVRLGAARAIIEAAAGHLDTRAIAEQLADLEARLVGGRP